MYKLGTLLVRLSYGVTSLQIVTSNSVENVGESFIPPELKERYIDVHMLAEGGMGRIIKARDSRLDKDVAIKLLPQHISKSDAIVRFQQEARALSRLKNPNIVQVLDFGMTSDGQPFLVMEFIGGSDLETMIERDGAIAPVEAIRIAIELCGGLAHAHWQGVVHRDLKPRNIMIDSDGHAKILDFGIAKMLMEDDSDGRLTRSGQLIGSPLYMSPEQVLAEPVDARTDIYGLGLLIFKMISGKAPFESDNLMELLRMRLEEPIPSLTDYMDDVTFAKAIDELLKVALSVRPDDRFESMETFAHALRTLIDSDEHSGARRYSRDQESSQASRMVAWSKEHKLLTLLVPTAGLLAAVCIFFVGTQQHPIGGKKQVPVKQQIAYLPDTKKKAIDHPAFSYEQVGNCWIHGANRNITDADLKKLIGTDVKDLRLNCNEKITDRGIQYLSQIPLNGIDMTETGITDRSAEYLRKMPTLTWLNFSNTKFSEKGLLRLAPLTSLRGLVLTGCSITDSGLRFIADHFKYIDYVDVTMTSVTPKGLSALKDMPHLRQLGIGSLELTDEDTRKYIVPLKLHNLQMANNPITERTLKTLCAKPELKKLDVTDCSKLSEAMVQKYGSKQLQIETTSFDPKKNEQFTGNMIEMLEQGGGSSAWNLR